MSSAQNTKLMIGDWHIFHEYPRLVSLKLGKIDVCVCFIRYFLC